MIGATSKKARIVRSLSRGLSIDKCARLAGTTLGYARIVSSEAGLSKRRFVNGPPKLPLVDDPDIAARRAHVERQKALFQKGAPRS
ncbi:MAG TPA: hypothetical protein PKE16_08025 [Hyphomicrobium sp.]|nr:hypothetical protein [Hyphomicrobium sp.]